VYAVGHSVLTADAVRMAGVLAIGPAAVLSHRAAAAHHGLRPFAGIEATLEQPHRRRPGIRLHQLPLPPDEVTMVRSVPVTTVPRTIFDLAAVVPRAQVERAMHEADLRRLGDCLSLPDLLDRYPMRRGAATIRAILKDGAMHTRSELEARFRSFLARKRLPRPEVNVPLFVGARWIECDFLWRDARVIVELDGRIAHDTARAFERDRTRDRALTARGGRMIRVTWRQLHGEPEALVYDLRTLLSAETGTAPSRSTFQLPSVS
jgi:very-short-patch-repair endonuclease